MSERLPLIWLISAALATAGCAARAPRPNLDSREGAPPAPPPPTTVVTPPRPSAHRVAVILGPGGAKAFAHVGVLKALQRQRVPIDKVVGLEWGALVGATFALHAQVHEVEWKLYKMEQRGLPRAPKGGLFGRGGGVTSVAVMSDFLTETFGSEDLARAKIPFACPSRSLWTGVVTWQTRGAWRDVLKRCLPYPPTFAIEGNAVAGATQLADAVELLRKDGFDVILFVNALGTAVPAKGDGAPDYATQAILWQEVRRALQRPPAAVEVIEVNTNQFAITEFEASRELARAGEAAGTAAAARLVQTYGF